MFPSREEDVAAWAAKLRDERLNETGRAAIDMLEHVVRRMLKKHPPKAKYAPEPLAPLAKAADQLLRAAFQADRAGKAQMIRDLRNRAKRQDQVSHRLKGLH